MISTQLVILLLVVAGLAFGAGFLFGRQSSGALNAGSPRDDNEARAEPSHEGERNPLPGPRSIEPQRPRSAPPPAQAGAAGSMGSRPDVAPGAPRRSSTPPPARAGLLDPGKGGSKK